MRNMEGMRPSRLAGWEQMLPRVERAVAAALEEVTAREKRLPAVAGDWGRSPLLDRFNELRQRLERLDTCGERAAATIAEVDAALAEGEKTLRNYLDHVEAVRRRLAEGAAGAIG